MMIVSAALIFSLLVTIQAAYTVYLMIYTWDQPEAHVAAAAPTSFDPPHFTFTVLLPARHEEEVIQETIERVVNSNYPAELIETLVVCEASDTGTIAKAQEKIDELTRERPLHLRVVTFNDRPINKPHGLNFGFAQSKGEVVTIFDAEDEIHSEIFNVVNTVMVREKAKAVQCGVQLMDYDSSWYSALNVLEYYFWFKSRLHFHAHAGMIPLGGNTVFFHRDVMETLGGWDENNLTEDADVGIRLSTLGEKVRVVYDDRYVTKEETPPSLGHFVKQRTRWSQGFIQTLKKGDWRKLDTFQQKFLAVYTLAFPLFQASLALYVPIALWMMLAIRSEVVVAMVLMLPLYLLLTHYVISVVGLYEFASAHGLRPPMTTSLKMAAVYLPYQWVLAYAALRAMLRHVRGVTNWEKTKHVGAHRVDRTT
ncbi:MAG TPA: glycosyltransferase [Chloroflexota bacterium]|nr:glycosyltransferase [Chloroflexota bacterium]